MFNLKRFIFILCIPNTMICALDYCKLCKKGSHTLCKYKEGPSERCVDYKKPEFTSSVKKYIVDVHNDIRNHIASGQEMKGALGRQPSASNMNMLQWDNELAEIAQRWADQCISLNKDVQHDECRKTDRFEVGQNILTALTPSPDIPEIAILILNWYKQVENVLPSDIENFSGIQRGKFLIGQYTQLVWAETRYLGCGMSTFRNFNKSLENSKYLHRLVCNYGPRGNLIGSSVYQRGIPCAKCPFGKCDSIRTSLCEGNEQADDIFEKSNSKFHTVKDSKQRTDIPTYLFTSVRFEDILEQSLAEFVQKLLENMNAPFRSDNSTKQLKGIKCSMENSTKSISADELFSAKQKLNLSKLIEDVFRTEYHVHFEPIRSTLVDKDLKKMANILNRERLDQSFLTEVYELENGKIIVEDCKHHQLLSQFEDDDMLLPKVPKSEEIVLPNGMVYKKLNGIWFHGRCRCNYVYRSAVGTINIVFKEYIQVVLTIITILLVK